MGSHESNSTSSRAALIAERLRQLSPAWREQFSAPGMQVFCAGARDEAIQIHRVGDNGGIVIGSLLARSRDLFSTAPDEQLRFDATQSQSFVQSRGKWLIDHAWGDYVAFGLDTRQWLQVGVERSDGDAALPAH